MRRIETVDLDEATVKGLSANDQAFVYNGLDCCVTLEVLNELLAQLDSTTASTYAFSRALQAPIMEMMLRGVLVDQERRQKALIKFTEQSIRLEQQFNRICREVFGFEINWRSNPQLIDLFYNVMRIPAVRKRNAQGRMAPTVNRDALERLQHYFWAEPLVLHILALRDLGKKISFLQTGIDPDGRMRTNFNIAGTNTGRLSSSMSDFGSGGNVQNIDRTLRSIFIADPGYKFANLDLEQADSRNLGALCWNNFVERFGEKWAGAYLDVCEAGDLHTNVTKMVWKDLPWTGDKAKDREIADQQFYRWFSRRDLSKKLGHGTNFFGQPPTMAKHSKVEVPLIVAFQKEYFSAFECIPAYHEWVRDELATTSQLTTLLGRRRIFWGRKSRAPLKELPPEAAETLRDAIAYCPQSMTADEVDTGLLRIWRAQRVQLLIQVHDSILFQYPEALEDEILPWALEALRVHIPLARGRDFFVPTEAKVGWNWGDFSEENPDGLVKWKGGDSRKRQEWPRKLSIHDL